MTTAGARRGPSIEHVVPGGGRCRKRPYRATPDVMLRVSRGRRSDPRGRRAEVCFRLESRDDGPQHPRPQQRSGPASASPLHTWPARCAFTRPRRGQPQTRVTTLPGQWRTQDTAGFSSFAGSHGKDHCRGSRAPRSRLGAVCSTPSTHGTSSPQLARKGGNAAHQPRLQAFKAN